MEEVNIKIYGQVQGVFFRKSAKEVADQSGVCGWIRNNNDGSVETLAVGPKEKLAKFVSWCKKGSPLAKVEKVEVSWNDDIQEFESFEILG